MQIVIDMHEKDYQAVKNGHIPFSVLDAIIKGTPLPKGHGRLKDADEIAKSIEAMRDGWDCYGNEYEAGKWDSYDIALDEVMDAPTIIEADKEAEG